MAFNHSEPSVQRLASLQFADLGWERFQQASHDIAYGLRGMRRETAHQYGTHGQPQGGIDLTIEDAEGRIWGFSCKRYKQYQPHDVRDHIKETTYEADQYIILTSKIASPSVRDEIRNHPKWEIWDSEDLSQKLRLEVPPETARRIVDHHFGPRFRREFLGLAAVGAFLPPEEFFRPYNNRKRLFHHDIPLVGRSAILTQLLAFASSEEHHVAILPGRGGIGKSRLLLEFSRLSDAAHPERAIRILNEGVPLSIEALDDLPPVPTLIIVDDAHRVSDFGLLTALLRERNDCRLLLATRPQGTDLLSSQLTRGGIDANATLELPPLSVLVKEEVRELAVHVLGVEQEHLADRLSTLR